MTQKYTLTDDGKLQEAEDEEPTFTEMNFEEAGDDDE